MSTQAPVAPPQTIIIMGVCGCGKSLVGSSLAQRLGGIFDDGDDFHPPANKAKMASGTPLTDEDRWPWYAALRARILAQRASAPVHVLACSALKKIYRDRLRGDDPEGKVAFVLLDGTRELISTRLAQRKGHFMNPALLDSQFSTLELTPDLLRVPIDGSPEHIVSEIIQRLQLTIP